MRKVLVVMAIAAGMLVAVGGCGGGSTKTVTDTVTTTVESEPSARVENEAPAAEPEAARASDRRAKSGGIEITVSHAESKPKLELVGGEYRPDTPEAEHHTIKAPQGGSYVYVATKVLNETPEGIDLTCSYPVEAKLRGAEGRRFDPVEELSEIPGNPECNELLQPGFSHKMTWAFLVPPTAEPEALEFTDVTNFNKEVPPAAVSVSVG